tara:strand:+ start:837 stop:1133 length:297 start_codon:yes stop_codon:yes gene_type:complete
MHAFQQQLNDSPLISVFEVEVTDQDGQADYIICDISVRGNQLIAQREAVSKKEENHPYIAKSAIDIDAEVFSLDDHLQDLYDEIWHDIECGDLYDIAK